PQVPLAGPRLAARPRHETDKVIQKGALAPAADAPDDEDVAAADREIEVVLDDEAAVGHVQIPHGDVSLGSVRHGAASQMPSTLVSTAKRPSVLMMKTMPGTTAEAAASATAYSLPRQ